MSDVIHVAFAGNPNCGKTTLFNAYTGAKLKVANWPGVTVEKKESNMNYHGHTYKLVDLPGTYSLTSYTMEEKLTRQYLLDNEVDVIVNVVDASSLERNMFFTLQLLELGKPVVVALNMMDIIEERGMEIDLHRMPEMLGVPVIPVSARKKTGLDSLMHAVAHHKDKTVEGIEHHHSDNASQNKKHDDYTMVYSDDIEEKIEIISIMLKKQYKDMENYRWHAIKLLENDEEIIKRYPLDLKDIADKSYESEIIDQKYEFIEEVIEEVLINKKEKSYFTDKIDKVLTNKFLGLPIFFGIMAIVFFLTFTIGDFIKGYFEEGLEWFSSATQTFLIDIGAGELVTRLVVEGIIAGVGGILTFLPNIFILFIALAFLEDSGYMSRVAYIMNGIMAKMGLSGKAFIPMLLGFGCTVPAIMATRTLEDPKDKLRTILVTPFMSCSARLPVYVLLSEMFFGKNAMIACYSMYLIGILVAMTISFIMSKTGGKKKVHTLLIELPEYKTPNYNTVMIYAWEKVKDYLVKAGTVIFVASVILWVLMNFNFSGMVEDMSQSIGAQIGKWLVPLMKPAGLGYWQIIVSLISGIAAKEVVVSSMSVLYGIGNIASVSGMSALAEILGKAGFTAINAYSMMLFCLLYVPCIATIASVGRETGSKKYAILSVIMQVGVAWLVSTLFYNIAMLIVR